MRWLILADDLTGACDTGAYFARCGFDTLVYLGGDGISSLNANTDGNHLVRIVSTGTRALPAAEAVTRTERVLAHILPAFHPDGIYQKVDSTLRGNPIAELLATRRVYGMERVLLAPAFPAQGRTVREGQVWVHGQRLEETVFGRDTCGGNLPALLRGAPDVHSLSLAQVREDEGALVERLRSPGIWIADAETDDDLHRLARVGLRAAVHLWCGSAGVARVLAVQTVPPDSKPEVHSSLSATKCLVIAGSRHPATAAQILQMQRAGIQVFSPGAEIFQADEPEPKNALIRALTAALNEDGRAVLSAAGCNLIPNGEQEVARVLAEMAREALTGCSGDPVSLVVTGGGTAAAVCAAGGCTQIHLLDEVQPGIAFGRMANGRFTGNLVVTKAGGFGDDRTLLNLAS